MHKSVLELDTFNKLKRNKSDLFLVNKASLFCPLLYKRPISSRLTQLTYIQLFYVALRIIEQCDCVSDRLWLSIAPLL